MKNCFKDWSQSMTLPEKETNFNLIISEFCIAWSLDVIENIQLQMVFSAG